MPTSSWRELFEFNLTYCLFSCMLCVMSESNKQANIFGIVTGVLVSGVGLASIFNNASDPMGWMFCTLGSFAAYDSMQDYKKHNTPS